MASRIELILLFYFEMLFKFFCIPIPLLTIYFRFHQIAKIYFDKVKNKNENDHYIFYIIKNFFCLKSESEKIRISYLFDLVSILKEIDKNKLKLYDISDFLEKIIIKVKEEIIVENEYKNKKENSNYNYQLIFDNMEINKYDAIIRAKLLNELIDYYNKIYINEDNIKNFEEIKQMNNEIIKNNINIFFQLDLNYRKEDIESKDITDIYYDIILALIKNKKINNFDISSKIIKQLDLENIYINEKLFNNLDNILKSDTDYIKRYIIKQKKDLFDEKKINFYYTIINCLLNKSFYKFHIILEAKQFISSLLESNELFNENIDNGINIKFLNIIKILCNSDYSKEIPKEDFEKLREVLNYYKYFLYITKKRDIIIISNILKYNMGNYKGYLEDYEKAKKYNYIKLLFETSNINKKDNLNKEREINQSFLSLEENLSKKELNSINIEDRQALLKYIMDEKQFLFQIFRDEVIKYLINSIIANLILDECIINFHINEQKDINIRLDKLGKDITFEEIASINNDLTNNRNKDYDKNLIHDFTVFFEMLENFKKEIFHKIKSNKFDSIKLSFKSNNNSIDNYISISEIGGFIQLNCVYPEDGKVIINDIIKGIINDTKVAKKDVEIPKQNFNNSTVFISENRNDNLYEEIIIKLSNGYYIGKESDKPYYIFDNLFVSKLDCKLKEISYISEIKCGKNKDYIPLIIVSKKKVNIYKYNKHYNILYIDLENIFTIDDNDYIFDLNEKENELIIFKENKLYHIINIYNKMGEITKTEIKKGKLNELLINDELKLFEINLKINAINGYDLNNKKASFIFSNKDNSKKILICSCKKENQNCILIKFLNQKEIFITTNSFEALCFYPCFENNQCYIGGNEKGGKIKLYSMDYNNCSFQYKNDLDIIDGGGAITNLLKIENNIFHYLQDRRIKKISTIS